MSKHDEQDWTEIATSVAKAIGIGAVAYATYKIAEDEETHSPRTKIVVNGSKGLVNESSSPAQKPKMVRIGDAVINSREIKRARADGLKIIVTFFDNTDLEIKTYSPSYDLECIARAMEA